MQTFSSFPLETKYAMWIKKHPTWEESKTDHKFKCPMLTSLVHLSRKKLFDLKLFEDLNLRPHKVERPLTQGGAIEPTALLYVSYHLKN